MEEPLLGAAPPGRPGERGHRFVAPVRTLLEEYEARRRRPWCAACNPVEPISRGLKNARFCLTFAAAAAAAAAPEVLAAAEAAALLLVYFGFMPNALWVRCPWDAWSYAFARSGEDLVALGLARAAAVLAIHRALPAAVFQYSFFTFSVIISAVAVPFAALKAGAVVHSGWRPRHHAPTLALCFLSIAFSLAHVAAAQGVIAWMRRRQRLGLADPEEGTAGGGGGGAPDGDALEESQVAAVDALLDPDSRFFTAPCGALGGGREVAVHFKAVGRGNGATDAGIVLIHPFGGGVHSWRGVMGPLAAAAGAAVAAFDRPGFGLTSRPQLPPGGAAAELNDSPYSMEFAAGLAAGLARHLGWRRVVFVGVGDGALVALMAAAHVRGAEPSENGDGTKPPGAAPVPLGAPTAATAAAARALQPSASLPESADLSWMGSAAPTANRREILRRLLRGDIHLLSPVAGAAAAASVPPRLQTMDEEVDGVDDIEAASGQYVPRPSSSLSESLSEVAAAPPPPPPLVVAGVAACCPDLSGRAGPPHLRVLGASTLGRQVLRDLLATEVGDVGRASAWAGSDGPPRETLALYRRRLQVGPLWDAALVEVGAAAGRRRGGRRALGRLLDAALGGGVPLLAVRGADDAGAAVAAARELVERAGAGGGRLEAVPAAARVPHEEAPAALAEVVGRFAAQVLS